MMRWRVLNGLCVSTDVFDGGGYLLVVLGMFMRQHQGGGGLARSPVRSRGVVGPRATTPTAHRRSTGGTTRHVAGAPPANACSSWESSLSRPSDHDQQIICQRRTRGNGIDATVTVRRRDGAANPGCAVLLNVRAAPRRSPFRAGLDAANHHPRITGTRSGPLDRSSPFEGGLISYLLSEQVFQC